MWIFMVSWDNSLFLFLMVHYLTWETYTVHTSWKKLMSNTKATKRNVHCYFLHLKGFVYKESDVKNLCSSFMCAYILRSLLYCSTDKKWPNPSLKWTKLGKTKCKTLLLLIFKLPHLIVLGKDFYFQLELSEAGQVLKNVNHDQNQTKTT